MEFADLHPGNVFQLLSNPTISWIRITHTCSYVACKCCDHNAVCLADGTRVNFSPRAEVRLNLNWSIPCRQCGNMVEEARRCYAIPTCYVCLPPPPPLELVKKI